jgi:hypothetical protein
MAILFNESTRQFLWQLMAERTTPSVNEPLQRLPLIKKAGSPVRSITPTVMLSNVKKLLFDDLKTLINVLAFYSNVAVISIDMRSEKTQNKVQRRFLRRLT